MDIKLLSKGELEELLQPFCDLYHCCFNDKIDVNIVRQRYLQNPLDELQMCVAIDKGKIVANYAVSPALLAAGDKHWKCALSLNTMTHPDYVGQGLFVNLAQRLYRHLAKEGYGMVYGFPNYIANRTFLTKLGWRNIYEYPTLELAIGQNLKYNDGSVEELNGVGCLSNVKSPHLHVDKNADYLQWRYANKPNAKYHYLKTAHGGWCVYKRYEKMINIVELHTQDADEVNMLVGYMEEKALQNGLEKLTVWSPVNSDQHLALEKLGFRNRYPITYFGTVDLGIGKKVGFDIYDYRNWSVNMGDDNVY